MRQVGCGTANNACLNACGSGDFWVIIFYLLNFLEISVETFVIVALFPTIDLG